MGGAPTGLRAGRRYTARRMNGPHPSTAGDRPLGDDVPEHPLHSKAPLEVMRRLVLAVVVPCFNVEKEIAAVIRGLPSWVASIIAVDDGSTDGTATVLRQLTAEDSRLTVISRDRNGGVGAAMVTGYRAALQSGADFIVKMDGDGQMDAAELPRLLQPLVEGRADYAKGNRFRHVQDLERMPRVKLIGNIVLTFVTKLVSGYWRIFDAQNGFTAISREALETLPLDRLDHGYSFENSVLALLNLEDRPVVDIPMPAVYWNERSSMRVSRIVVSFPPRLARMFLRRLLYKYVVYDTSPVTLHAVLGTLLSGFGTVFGAYHWWRSIQTGIPATAGTVVAALLPFLMGFLLLLQAMSLDIAQSPRLRDPREEIEANEVPRRFGGKAA